MQEGTDANTEQIHFRTCNICEASCGLEIRHKGAEIISIKGDKHDPLSRGHICPKGVALQDLQNDPDRLRKPLRRTASGWEEISWQEALDEVGQRLRVIQDRHGNDAVGLYIGNPTAHNHGALLMLAPFIKALNTRSRFSATSCDQLPQMLSCLKMFGHFASFPVPDVDRSQYFLCLGANPLASNGSVMTAPGFPERMKSLHKRGGKWVVIDPRRTESAKEASEHHFIRPGTDCLFLLSLLQVIFAEKLDRLGAADNRVRNLDVLKNACAAYTTDRVARITGIDADSITRIAREFAGAKNAVAYGRVGISTSQFSTLNAWLIYALNIVTGNLDRAGGLMFALPAIDLAGLAGVIGETGTFDTWRSRVQNLPEFGGEIPVTTMADEILTAGEGQIRAMIIHAGNPVLSVPNGKRLDEAFAGLEFMVSIDIYLNETSRHAHIILPPTGPLEHGHYELALHGVAVRNTVKYSPPLLTPPPGTLHDWQILAELTARLESRSRTSRWIARRKLSLIQKLGDEGILDWLLRLGPYGKGLHSVEKLSQRLRKHEITQGFPAATRAYLQSLTLLLPKVHEAVQASAYGTLVKHPEQILPSPLDLEELRRHPHGIDLGPLHPLLQQRIYHADGLIDLAPDIFVQDLARPHALLEMAQHEKAPADDQPSTANTLMLIGRRHVRCNNSWMHNSERLVKGKRRCDLMISPLDAHKLGVTDGQEVWLQSRSGRVRLPLRVSDDIMPGVVSMPHGWGHDRPGISLQVASRLPGVSMNDVTDEKVFDRLTGMAIVNGIPVTINPVRFSET